MLKYFISREFFLTLFFLAVLGVVAYVLVFLLLDPYTRRGKAVVVPDVFEQKLGEAGANLEELGLNYVVRDCTFIPDLPPQVVVAQYPIMLSRVKPNRTIFFTLNQRKPPMVPMPEWKDKDLYHTRLALESWKLKVGTVTFQADFANDVVLDAKVNGRTVNAKTPLPQGTSIDLVVARSKISKKVVVPNLIGLTYEQAQSTLQSRDLNIGSVGYNPDGPAGLMGQIYSQNPKTGMMGAGQSVDIYLYGTAPETKE